MNYELKLGDNLATLKHYPDNTFDSIITDPPYGIEFLGKDWDKHTGTLDLYKECLRVLKPGGYMLAFSAARTYHQLASNIELAGFEIRDQIMWLYGSGFPKAQDIGKAIEKREGKRTTLPSDNGSEIVGMGTECSKCGKKENGSTQYKCQEEPCPLWEVVKPAQNEWAGFKTALKPAHEPIVMARKPFKGSTIDNVLKNGLGAMNIDATRVPWADEKDAEQAANNPEKSFEMIVVPGVTGLTPVDRKRKKSDKEKHEEWTKKYLEAGRGEAKYENYFAAETQDRPSEAVEVLKKKKSDRDKAKGATRTPGLISKYAQFTYNEQEDYIPGGQEAHEGGRYPSNVIGEVEDGYQKYFYCPKVSRKERHIGFGNDSETTMELLAAVGGHRIETGANNHMCHIPGVGDMMLHGLKHEVERIRKEKGIVATNIGNNHPTVKPVALMDYLIKLVTPPSTPDLQRKVLDPFMGSGSTGMAATKLGHHFTGCELDPKYVAIAATRIEAWNAPEIDTNELPSELFDVHTSN